jgi:cell wall-associated NlpC family hydrolase
VRKITHLNPLRFRRLCVLPLLAASLGGAPAWSQPAPNPATLGTDSRGDELLRLISERGWSPTELVAPHVRQVRDAASELVLTAFNFLGLQYRSGGNSVEQGFDCSGFVRYLVQNTMGHVLPRTADQQAQASTVFAIDAADLRPGDLVFFNTLRQSFSHVGIYVGDNKFIHSPRTGSSVRVEDMRLAYWTQRFNGARRIQEPAAQR